MKKQFRTPLLIMLAMLIIPLFSIAFVKADPIGSTLQAVPIEVSPTATLTGSATVTNPTYCRDKDYEGTAASVPIAPTTTFFGVMTFERASDLGKTEFTIGWVDIHIKWACPALTNDLYRFEYAVGGSGYQNLYPTTGDVTGAAAYTSDADTAAVIGMGFHNKAELVDGVWTWQDIVDTKVRIYRTLVSPADGKTLKLFEIWMTVYPDTVELPPAPVDGSGVSIQPPVVAPITELDPIMYTPGTFFVDIYLKNIPPMAGWEATFTFNTTALTPSTAFTYYPWTFTYAKDLIDAEAYVHLSFAITDSANPYVDTGLPGTFPIARVYFQVDPANPLDPSPTKLVVGPSPLHWDTQRIFKFDNPGGTVHYPVTPYDGLYGVGVVPEFPLGLGILMMLAPAVAIGYLWRTRPKKKVA